jgi:hypothetical protein
MCFGGLQAVVMLVWPLFVCSTVCAMLLFGISPSLGQMSYHDTLSLSQHHTSWLLALLVPDVCLRCCLVPFGTVLPLLNVV